MQVGFGSSAERIAPLVAAFVAFVSFCSNCLCPSKGCLSGKGAAGVNQQPPALTLACEQATAVYNSERGMA
jgi:hypothetical protein